MDLEKVDIIKDYLEYKGWTDSEIERFIYNENIDESYEKIIDERAQIDIKNRIKNSLRAFIIGDALGVPFEFKERGTFNCTGFVGGGIHQKEAGTWSDDTSIMLCLLDALNNTKTMKGAVELLKKNLKDWYYDGKFTADGDTFDVGRQTAAAIECDFRNDRLTDRMGNGALFYTPIVFHFLYREFKIRDSEDASNVFITNDDIKRASAVYNTTTSGTTVYLQIEFNEKGKDENRQEYTGFAGQGDDGRADRRGAAAAGRLAGAGRGQRPLVRRGAFPGVYGTEMP